jgi:hypothetical protein
MVHLTLDNRPICEHGYLRCQYSTRRDAFDALLRLGATLRIAIEKGPCPNFEKERRGES